MHSRRTASYQSACYRLRGLRIIGEPDLKELLEKDEQAHHFLGLLEVGEDFEAADKKGKKKADRKLMFELLSLAVEALYRGLISKAKFLEIGQLIGLERNDMLRLAKE